MATNLVNIVAVLLMAGALTTLSPLALASEPVEAAVIRGVTEGATTQEEHEAAAKQYEEVATELQAKLVKKKELLEHYKDKSYLYARRSQDLQSYTYALIRN